MEVTISIKGRQEGLLDGRSPQIPLTHVHYASASSEDLTATKKSLLETQITKH